jgi:hypothetical protein
MQAQGPVTSKADSPAPMAIRCWATLPRVLWAVTTLLLVAACTSGPSPSPSASGTPPSRSASPYGLGLTSGLSDPLSIAEIQDANLDDYAVSALAVTKTGQVWAAADERTGEMRRGVWHGTVGSAGTWYPFAAASETLGWTGGIQLAVAPDGQPWIDVAGSLMTYQGGAWRTVEWPNGTTATTISSPMVAPDGAIWVQLNPDDPWGQVPGSLLRYDGTVTGVPGPSCWSPTLVMAADGTVWTGGLGDSIFGLAGGCQQRFDGTTWTTTRPLDGTKDTRPLLVTADPQGPVWAWLVDVVQVSAHLGASKSNAQSLARFEGTAWTTFTTGLPPGAPTSMVARNGILWVVMHQAPWEGPTVDAPALYRFDGTGWSKVSSATNFIPESVLAADPDGSVWIATADGVLHRVPPGLPW